ncbi:MAG: insulinase family protein, partial [Thermodesulfobacteriota bacterium]
WYRPENMVLVMAGDFDLQEVKGLIEKKFRDLQGSGPVPPCPQLGRVQHGDGDSRYFYHHEEELGYTGTTIETLWNVEPQHDSLALQVEELTRYVANRMVQHRLDELARKSDSPFSSARIYGGTFLDRIRYGSVTAKCDPGQWQESLVLLENSLRQALEHGFTAGELQRVQKELLAELDSAVLTASSRNSRKLVSSIIRAINDDRVLFSPEQEKEIFAPVVEKMNLADVEKAFRGTWSQRNHLVSLEGNVKIAAKDPLALMASVHGRASERKVSPYIQEKLHAFPYLQLQGGQPPVSKEEFSEIESKRFVFANGLVLNLKNTDFEENEVKVSADFGLGRGSEPTPGLARLTGAVIDLSGTATLNREALERIVAGTSVKLKFHVTPAAFSWQGKALNRDLELLFQVLQSLLADPGVDDEAYQVVMDRFRKNYESLSRDVGGAMKLRGERFLAGGNPFFGVPPWSEFSKLSTEEIRKWFLPATARGPLEISLVGDFDEKEVLALAEKYFSVLSKRENGEMEQVALSFPGGESLDLTVPSSIDKGMLVVAWKTDDFWDIRRTRGLHVLAEIFSDKMRRLIREKLGATYSPQVYNVSSRIHKGYGVMRAVLVVDPEQMEMLEKEVLHLAEEMYQGTISEEELERAKGPMLTSLKDMVRTNRYWLHSVLSLSFRYPQQLQWPGTILSGFASFSLEDVQGLSRSYLNPKEAAVISVLPE